MRWFESSHPSTVEPVGMSSSTTLHVTNGDAVVHGLRKAGIIGTHLGWRDPLMEGPVPHGLDLRATSAVRTAYLSACGYGVPIRVIREFERRDAIVARAREFDEVVLWFEHDLYDQLQLLQVLVALDALDLPPGSISTIASDAYLGTLSAPELLAWLPRRRTASEALMRSARRAWERFTADEPLALNAAAAEESIGLPFLRAAMRRLSEEYPSTRDGLSRTERGALLAVAQGPAAHAELYRRSQRREEASFHGDRGFVRVLAQLRDQPAALVEGSDEALVPTELGRAVLAGTSDWLEHRPIDRWIGGVHLTGRGSARWDDERERLVAT